MREAPELTERAVLGNRTRIFICMDAARRRDRLVSLLSVYGQLEVVGTEVADHRALRAVVARDPDVVIMAPVPETVDKAAWLARRVQEALPHCAIVVAAGDHPNVRLPGQVDAQRRLPVDAPLADLIEATLHAARPHDLAVSNGARARRG